MIKTTLAEYNKLLDREDFINPEVSKWSVYKHIEHILTSDLKISEKILAYNPSEPISSGMTLLGRFVLLFKFIPRGRGKAPDFTLPCGISHEELRDLYQKVLENFAKLDVVTTKDIVAIHPYFGGLNKKQWLKFIEIHHKHHMKIIKEILA